MVDWLDKKNGTIAIVILYIIVLFMVFFVEFDNNNIVNFEVGDNNKGMINIDILVSSIILALIPLYYGILTYIKKKSILKSLVNLIIGALILILANTFIMGFLGCMKYSDGWCFYKGIFFIPFIILAVLAVSVLMIIGLLFHKYYSKKRK